MRDLSDGLQPAVNEGLGFWDQPHQLEFWRRVVRLYSRGLLTRESDKLIALSGVIKWLHGKCSSRYLAGLWEQDFLQQLLWRTPKRPFGIEGIGFRYDTYVAPSWSWASMNAVISMEEIHSSCMRDCVTLLDAHVTPLGEDEFGQVCNG